MKISKITFVMLFVVSGFAFQFFTTSLLGSTGIRGSPKYPDTFLSTATPIAWKQTIFRIILPLKVILTGPVAFSGVNFLKEDPPPPFVAGYFLVYWSILALIIYVVANRFKEKIATCERI